MARPSFIVLGAVKAGTTSLYNYLGQHPEIQMSAWNWPRYFHIASGAPDFTKLAERYGDAHRTESEGRFNMMFPARIPRSIKQYEALWPATDTARARGEVSPTYLHDPDVCTEIARRKPAAKLIIALRNPVERAYSHFVMDRRKGWEQIGDFGASLNEEPIQASNFFWGRRHYIRHGLYADAVARYKASFPRKQIKVMFYEDLVREPETYLADILDFIDVDPKYPIDMSMRHNKGLVRHDTKLTRLLYGDFPGRQFIKRRISKSVRAVISKQITSATHAAAEPMQPQIRKRLIREFRNDIQKLQPLVDRDLTSWMT